ncbi:hypothetical protein ACKKBG_A00725 [Auxenochlorella protothecoides x Auxenochlorella symbiontica]|nr:hypothetical protein F751_0254 [Auxenochlorella protothecoides]KFM27582.1 hypothetical protein F751_0254 [Auxenochlorella protothecoides]RMZ56320.1 hypothetical protein APUTEX25_000559 [Auxenochlorella protothecoides]|eukprot:RMZ56320.1 hypothetical protein APUTEX25_000559 [Auxenochlorella protothecoides]
MAEKSEDSKPELYNEKDVSIRVSQKPGYLCRIEAECSLPLPPDTLFHQIVTHPDNATIFRNMDSCTFRKILQRSDAVRVLEVEHAANWRILLFRGTFKTRLRVHENREDKVMRFELLPGRGIMKRFNGEWRFKADEDRPGWTSTHLHQELALNINPPPPVDRLVKAICRSVVLRLVEDVQAESTRIHQGRPSLVPWEQVDDKEIL